MAQRYDFDEEPTSRTTYGPESTNTEITVPPNSPIPVEFVPSIWTALQSGSWAIILVVVVLWSKYGNKIVDYLDCQKEIQESLLKLHEENTDHKKAMNERMSRVENHIETLLRYLTQDVRFEQDGSRDYPKKNPTRAKPRKRHSSGDNDSRF